MSDVHQRQVCVEAPVYFPSVTESLFGIHVQPASGALGPPVLIASGGLTGTSTVGRNQMFVRLSHQLAEDGLPSMRLDYHGIGESTGLLSEFRLDAEQPFVDDLLGAARWLEAQGARRLFLVGKCFGSRMALATSGELLDRLDGVVLIGAPLRNFGKGERTVTRLATELSLVDYLKRALKPEVLRGLGQARNRRTYTRAALAKLRHVAQRARPSTAAREGANRWTSPAFLDRLEALVDHKIPVVLVYGVDDDFYQDFQRARQQGRLRDLLERGGTGISVTTTPGQVAGFVQVEVQDAIIEATCAALRQWSGGTGRARP